MWFDRSGPWTPVSRPSVSTRNKKYTNGMGNKGSNEKALAYNQSKSTFSIDCFSFVLFKKVHLDAAPPSFQ